MTEEPIKVVLFAADCGGYDIERSMEELAALAQANGMEAVAEVVQKRETPEAATFLGEGRLAEGRMLCLNLGAECAVFDAELSGSQIRNLEELLEVCHRILIMHDGHIIGEVYPEQVTVEKLYSLCMG